jgi:uncharacterized membrane protein YbhN (UPF0104 family)
LSAPIKIAGKPRIRNSWNWIGFVLSIAIVGISAYVLANILKDVDFGRVVAHVRAMPAVQVGWAVIFIAGAYATLTCYDFFAVRTIGANHASRAIRSVTTSAPLPFPAARYATASIRSSGWAS